MAALAALIVLHSPAAAEDERGRWSLGLGGGILSTFDDIRNNAAVVRLRDQGRLGDISDDTIAPGSVDPRQDDLLGRGTTIEESQTYDVSAAYGLTSWLSVQVDIGHYKGNLSNLDTFRVERRFVDANHDNFLNSDTERFATPLHDASVPISAGELRQMPVTLSALFRFRRDSPFNPILGAGVGWVFTDLQDSQALADLNGEILAGFQRTQVFSGAANVQAVEDAQGNIIVNTDCAMPANRLGTYDRACTKGAAELEVKIQEYRDLAAADPDNADLYRLLEEEKRSEYAAAINADFIPTRPLVTAKVEDGFAYQMIGGAEYHFNDRWSAYVLGRYLVTKANVTIRIRDNGNLFTARPTDPGLETVNPVSFDLEEALFRFQAKANIEGPLGTAPGSQPAVLEDSIFVQGGDINLSSFSLSFGLRYTF